MAGEWDRAFGLKVDERMKIAEDLKVCVEVRNSKRDRMEEMVKEWQRRGTQSLKGRETKRRMGAK